MAESNLVRVTCTKDRFVGNESYVKGDAYRIDAFIAGKYEDYFAPVSDDDIRKVREAVTAREQLEADRKAARLELDQIDPALLLVAARAIQQELAKAGKSAAAAKV